MYWAKIIDPKSDLYDPEKAQNNDNIENIMPEIGALYRDECALDFRKAIHDVSEALKVKPEVKKIDGSRLRLNFSAVGRKMTAPAVKQEVLSSEFGTRLEEVILQRIGTMTEGRPKLREALMKEAHERGVLTLSTQKEQKTVAKLLNQDMLADIGGTKSVLALREALVARLKKANPDMKKMSDNDIMPMDRAIAACEELKSLSSKNASATPRTGRIVLLGKDLSHLFNEAAAVDGIGGKSKPDPAELVSASDFLESLKIPAVANMNIQGIWRNTISAEKLIKPSPETTPVVQIAEGKHSIGIGITTLMMQGEDEHISIPVHIMKDDARKKTLIVTDTVDAPTKAALGNDYTVVAYGDADAEKQVAAFISASLEVASQKSAHPIEQWMTYAFMLRAGNESEIQPLARMMTTRGLPAEAPVYIVNQLG
jgi:hypothetical protein